MFRLPKGRSFNLDSGSTVPTDDEVVASNVSAATDTSTVWDTVPTCSVKFSRACCPMPSVKLLATCVWKPGNSAANLYVPGCRLANWYVPASLVSTVVTIPVALLAAVIVTPGIKAPLLSATVPPNVALVVCEAVYVEKMQHSKMAAMATDFFIRCSSIPNSSAFGAHRPYTLRFSLQKRFSRCWVHGSTVLKRDRLSHIC